MSETLMLSNEEEMLLQYRKDPESTLHEILRHIEEDKEQNFVLDEEVVNERDENKEVKDDEDEEAEEEENGTVLSRIKLCLSQICCFRIANEKVLLGDRVRVRAVFDCSVWESENWSRLVQDESTQMQRTTQQMQRKLHPLSFQKGDVMGILDAFDIGKTCKLLIVRDLTNGHIGYIPRVHVVFDYDQHSAQTFQWDELPLELLDMILQKSYLRFLLSEELDLNRPSHQDIICTLASVDDCWSRMVTRRRFKKTIFRHISVFFRKVKVMSTIIGNNKKYLEANMQPTEEFIKKLHVFNCLSEEESISLIREERNRSRNGELLYMMRSFDDKKHSAFRKCLRQSDQKQILRLLEYGGVTVRAKIQFTKTKKTARTSGPLVLFNIAAARDLEIVDTEGRVVWIWCKSQDAFVRLQEMNELSAYSDTLLALIKHLSCGNIIPTNVRISINQFKRKSVVCRTNEIKFTKRLKLNNSRETVWGVATLRNAIHVLSRFDFPSPSDRNSIFVFENRLPFRVLKKIEIKEIEQPRDIGSSERENCLYVIDSYLDTKEENGCIWKISGGTNHQVMKWLPDVGRLDTLSVSSDGQLLLVRSGNLSSNLFLYGPDAVLRLSLQLPEDIKRPEHAVYTPTGNYIVVHELTDVIQSSGEAREWWGHVISILSRNGKTVIRRFFPKDKMQELKGPKYISLDAVDDRVFVADRWNHRVIELDSNLNWKRFIVYETKEANEIEIIRRPWRLCYDEEKKQLIVGGFETGEANVYTFN